jgi:hypothetical protein
VNLSAIKKAIGSVMSSLVAGLIILAVTWYLQQSDRPALQLTYLHRRTAVDESGLPNLADLQTTLAGQPLRRLDVFSFALANTGRRPITTEEFNSDIRIAIPGTLVKAYGTVGNTQRPLLPKLDTSSGWLAEKPILLNPGDEVRFDAQSIDAPPDAIPYPDVARITGVPDIAYVDLVDPARYRLPAHLEPFLWGILTGIAVYLGSRWYRRIHPPKNTNMKSPSNGGAAEPPSQASEEQQEISFPDADMKSGVHHLLRTLIRQSGEEIEASLPGAIGHNPTTTGRYIDFAVRESLVRRDQVKMQHGVKITPYGQRYAESHRLF